MSLINIASVSSWVASHVFVHVFIQYGFSMAIL